MSLGGMLFRGPVELRVRRVEGLGEGEVLRGSVSVEAARDRDAWRGVGGGERYVGVDGYDAVLRGHCRLDREG